MESEDNFKCNLCNNAYKYQGTLKTHIMVKHCKSFSYNCTHCEYHWSPVDSVKHQTSKDQSDTDGCKTGPVIDDKIEAKIPLIIQQEAQIYIEQKGSFGKFRCDKCERQFKKKSHLDEHTLIHSGKRPFPCEKCGFGFRRADKMRKHMESCNYVNRNVAFLRPEERMSSKEMWTSMTVNPEGSREVDSEDNLDKAETPKEQRTTWKAEAPPSYWVWGRYICEICKKDCGYVNNLGQHRKRSHGLSYHQEKLGYNSEIENGWKIKQNPNEPAYGTLKRKGRRKKYEQGEGGRLLTKAMPCFGCKACKSDDCMECTWCHDKKKHGGPGRLRKRCIKRRCTQPKIVEMMDHMPNRPMKMVRLEGGGNSRIHYTTTPIRTTYLQAGGLVKAMPCRFGQS